jgi:catalase
LPAPASDRLIVRRVTGGIELSDDPVLHIRTYVYSESVRRRSGMERPDCL